MEISKEMVDKFNRAREELLRRLEEDPKFRAECEETKRRLDDFYTAGRKPYKPKSGQNNMEQ